MQIQSGPWRSRVLSQDPSRNCSLVEGAAAASLSCHRVCWQKNEIVSRKSSPDVSFTPCLGTVLLILNKQNLSHLPTSSGLGHNVPESHLWRLARRIPRKMIFHKTQDGRNLEKVGENPGSLVGRLLPRAEPTKRRFCAGLDVYPSCISIVKFSKRL